MRVRSAWQSAWVLFIVCITVMVFQPNTAWAGTQSLPDQSTTTNQTGTTYGGQTPGQPGQPSVEFGTPALGNGQATGTNGVAQQVAQSSGATNGLAQQSVQSSGASNGVAQQAVQSAAAAQLDQIPTHSIDEYWRNLQNQYGSYLPDVSGESLVKAIMTSGGFNTPGLVHGLLRYFFSEVFGNAQLLGGILILTVLAAVLESLQAAFERQAVSQVAYVIIFLVLMVLAIGSFTQAFGYGRHAIQSMNDFMLATVPIMIALLTASGALVSAAFFQPMLVFAIHFISNVVFVIVFPLIFVSAVLEITSALSPRYKLTRLAGLLRTGGIAVLGFCMASFLGVTTIQGIGKGVVDGVALRAAKFAASNFIPVIGKAVSDATEAVASASMLAKNAVGIASIVIIACIALFPALKILALSFIYNGSAALMQPLGDNPLIACLGSLSKSLMLVFASVTAVSIMFFISICILLASATLAVTMA